MKAILLTMTALILAAGASAEERHHGGGRGFVGRSSGVAHVGGGAFRVSGPSSPVSAQAPVAHVAPVAHAGSGSGAPAARGFSRGGFASSAPRASTRSSFGNGHRLASVTRWAFTQGRMRRVDGDSGGTGGTGDGTTPPPQRQPGDFGTVDGALLRSEGLGFKYEAADPARQFAVEGGDHISADENRVIALGGRGVFTGPRDTPPGANTTASGSNAITANATLGQ